ncbi:hypothetical protein EDD16DRAFT_1519677 [Pisolithus croceorrhizus]|nr:hypothetical protein EDD16DRAFT_1519677 [Pisolithus croceorrhizus]
MTKFLTAISLWHMSMANPPFGLTPVLEHFTRLSFKRGMDLVEMFLLINLYKIGGGRRDRITTLAGGMMPWRYHTKTLPWRSKTVEGSEICPHWGYGKYFILSVTFFMGSENLSMTHSVTSSTRLQAPEFYFPSVRTLTSVKDCKGNDKGRQLEFQGGNGYRVKDFLCQGPLEVGQLGPNSDPIIGCQGGCPNTMGIVAHYLGFWRSDLCSTEDAVSLEFLGTDVGEQSTKAEST